MAVRWDRSGDLLDGEHIRALGDAGVPASAYLDGPAPALLRRRGRNRPYATSGDSGDPKTHLVTLTASPSNSRAGRDGHLVGGTAVGLELEDRAVGHGVQGNTGDGGLVLAHRSDEGHRSGHCRSSLTAPNEMVHY